MALSILNYATDPKKLDGLLAFFAIFLLVTYITVLDCFTHAAVFISKICTNFSAAAAKLSIHDG